MVIGACRTAVGWDELPDNIMLGTHVADGLDVLALPASQQPTSPKMRPSARDRLR